MSKDLPKYHCNRDIKYLIIHCSASKITSNFSVAALRHLHVDINHWSDIGYHFYITKDGVIHVSGKNNKTKDYIFTQDFEFDKEMPVDAKLCASKASVKDGVLFINIPKERKKEHNIPID